MSILRRKIGASLAALAVSSALIMGGVATSTPAEAHGWGYGYGYGHHHRHYWRHWYPYGGYYGGCY
jgi:hypothetical protein